MGDGWKRAIAAAKATRPKRHRHKWSIWVMSTHGHGWMRSCPCGKTQDKT